MQCCEHGMPCRWGRSVTILNYFSGTFERRHETAGKHNVLRPFQKYAICLGLRLQYTEHTHEKSRQSTKGSMKFPCIEKASYANSVETCRRTGNPIQPRRENMNENHRRNSPVRIVCPWVISLPFQRDLQGLFRTLSFKLWMGTHVNLSRLNNGKGGDRAYAFRFAFSGKHVPAYNIPISSLLIQKGQFFSSHGIVRY